MAPNTEDNYNQILDWCFKNTKILELKDNNEKCNDLLDDPKVQEKKHFVEISHLLKQYQIIPYYSI